MSITLATLAEVKTHLRNPASATDSQLTDLLEAASEACEKYTGRVWSQRSVTEVHTGGCDVLILRSTPVASITSVTESGTALTATDYVLDDSAGLLYRGTTTTARYWAAGRLNITVVMTCGPAAVPDTIKQGVLDHVKHLWLTQLGGTAVPRVGAEDEWSPELGEYITRRVAQAWRPHKLVGG